MGADHELPWLGGALSSGIGSGGVLPSRTGLGDALSSGGGLGGVLGLGSPGSLGLISVLLSPTLGLGGSSPGSVLVLGLGSGFCFGPGLGEALGFGEGLAVPPPDAEELPPEPQDFFPAHTPFVTYSTPSSPRVRMLTSLAFISSLNGLIFSLSSCSHSLTLMVQYDVLWTVS